MAFGLAAYVSQCGTQPTQDSLPGAGQALLGGLSTRRVPLKGFRNAILTSLPPFPSLLGAIPENGCRIARSTPATTRPMDVSRGWSSDTTPASNLAF